MGLKFWVSVKTTRNSNFTLTPNILFNHVRARDFPVSKATFQALGRQAGLEGFAVLLEDRARLNALVTFSLSHGETPVRTPIV